MGDVPQCVLFEHAIGYVLFRVMEFEDIGISIPQVSFLFLKEQNS